MTTHEELKALKRRHAAKFWSNAAVCGIDIDNDAEGNPCFTVHLRSQDPSLLETLPVEVEGHPVRYLYNPIEKQWSEGPRSGRRSVPTQSVGTKCARRGGFTLVELMVVIVLIGLLAGAVSLGVRGYLITG